jgi:predicted alpha/beta-hydrolase family hydrolase
VAAGDPLELDTPHGVARVHLRPVEDPVAALVLGHGAGGSVSAPDLLAVADAARDERVAVALVEQPYRVAGRRSPAPTRQLDVAWVAVVEQLRAGPLAGLDVVVGGRSSGARVACRTAAATEARAVLCLAFPLQPPRRRSAAGPPPSRLEELDAVQVPVLVVQGDRDPFGLPPGAPGRTVAAVAGTHRLSSDLDGVAAAARAWLGDLLA